LPLPLPARVWEHPGPMAETELKSESPRPPRIEPLRWIGAYKLLKAALSLVAGLMLLRLMHRDLPAAALHWMSRLDIDPESRFGALVLRKLLQINAARLQWVAIGLFAYVPLAMAEGIGLILRKLWAEWVTVVTTAALIPVEIHHVIKRPTWLGALILVLNILVLIYLLVRIRRDRRRHASQHEKPALRQDPSTPHRGQVQR
jgi:uncharacterized membrane protein (DUF2068 family)